VETHHAIIATNNITLLTTR